MSSDAGEREKIVESEIAVADSVDAVSGDARKTKFACNGIAIDGKRIPGKGAGTHGTGIRARGRVLQPSDVTREGFGMGQEKVRKQDWLGMLHVRHARHGHIAIGFGLLQEGIQETFQGIPDLCRGIDDEEAKIGCDKFVAAAAGVQIPAERAEFFDERFFDEMMHVFGIGADFFKPREIGLRASF